MTSDGSQESPLNSAVQTAGEDAVGAFKRLGNHIRLAILVALWEGVDPFAEDNSMSFSVLRDRVGTPDSGQFNYHLDQMTDTFVQQTDTGYRLSPAGFHIVAAVIAGTGTSNASLGPVGVDATCPLCNGTVEVMAENEMMAARCTDCSGLWGSDFGTEGLLFRFGLPPAAIEDRTPTEVFHSTVTYNLNRLASFRNGVCPVCAGHVEHAFEVCEDHDGSDGPCQNCGRRHLSEVLMACKRCKTAIRDPIFMAALTHPAITAFLYDHGVAHEFDTWEGFSRGMSMSETLISADPLQIRFSVPYENDQLSLVLHGERGIQDFVVDK